MEWAARFQASLLLGILPRMAQIAAVAIKPQRGVHQ
jgi:hypothetical protein